MSTFFDQKNRPPNHNPFAGQKRHSQKTLGFLLPCPVPFTFFFQPLSASFRLFQHSSPETAVRRLRRSEAEFTYLGRNSAFFGLLKGKQNCWQQTHVTPSSSIKLNQGPPTGTP
jgi:hypothetical protein